MNLAVIDDISQLPSEATVRPRRAHALHSHMCPKQRRASQTALTTSRQTALTTSLCLSVSLSLCLGFSLWLLITAQVEVHRASALGWDGIMAATKSSLPTVSQAGIASTISPPNSPHRCRSQLSFLSCLVCLSVCLSCLSVCLSVCPSVRPSVRLCVCPCVGRSVCLPIRLTA